MLLLIRGCQGGVSDCFFLLLPGCCAVAISVLMSSKCHLHVIVVMWLPGCYYTVAVRLLRCSKCILHVSMCLVGCCYGVGNVFWESFLHVVAMWLLGCCYAFAKVVKVFCESFSHVVVQSLPARYCYVVAKIFWVYFTCTCCVVVWVLL